MSLRVNGSPGAILFDGQVVAVHSDSEESRFTPISSPTVSGYPIFSSVLDSPADYSDFVVNTGNQFYLLENTPGVGVKLLGSIDAAGNWTSSEDLGFHFISTRNTSVLFDFPGWVMLLSPTVSFVSRFGSSWWRTIHTFLNV